MNDNDICQEICYGCSACANICPVHSIIMEEDKKGFLYPKINQSLCINCRICSRVCNSTIELKKNKETYIAKHKDERTLLSSQSGGAFTAISDCILEQGGVVYGAALDDKFEAVHIRAEDMKNRDRIKGSKYIPSKLNDTFTQVKNDLNSQKYVLFTGLPCQVGGLLKYLKAGKQDTNRLYTTDIICHGTPSILLWRDLIQYYENRYHAKIERAVFRDKNLKHQPQNKNISSGWGHPCYNFYIKKKLVSDELHRQLFYSNLALRDSCYQCKYTKTARVGDFTIGDAWGVQSKHPEFFDSRGVSLLMINSSKAAGLVSKLQENMLLQKVLLEDYMQGNMRQPSAPHRNKDEFWKDYFNKKFTYIILKYAKNNVFLNYRHVIKKLFHKLKELSQKK